VAERWPDFVIVGTMRSGTTSLYRHLADHPEVDPAVTKEIRYFTKHFELGDDWYRSQFPGRAGRITGEATPSYMHDRSAVDRMAAAIPDAKLIAILRHPAERAWSHYLMRRSLGQEPRSFAAALEEERNAPSGSRREFDDYLSPGQYAEQLEHISTHYPRDRLQVHLFDDLARDPASVYDATCEFLGIAASVRPPHLDTRVNAHAQYRSVALRRLAKRGPHWLRNAVGRINASHAPPAPLDRELRAELIEHFRPHNQRLAARLGRDLSDWDV
jgi:hypothetical protein